MNIIDIQDDLKNLPEQALMQEMQRPTGSAPQFLVLGELKRRKQMRDDYNRQQNSDMKTVAEEVVTAAGAPQEGIMQMARSLNPNTNMAQDTGLAQATPVTPTQAPQPQAPQMMSGGGIMRMAEAGKLPSPRGVSDSPRLSESLSPYSPIAFVGGRPFYLSGDGQSVVDEDGNRVTEPSILSSIMESMASRSEARDSESPAVEIGSPEGIGSVSADAVDFVPEGVFDATQGGDAPQMDVRQPLESEMDRFTTNLQGVFQSRFPGDTPQQQAMVSADQGAGRAAEEAAAELRGRISGEDIAMGMPVPTNDFRTFPVEAPLTRDEQIVADARAAIERYGTNAGRDAVGNLLPVAPEPRNDYGARRDAAGNLLTRPPSYLLEDAIEAANAANKSMQSQTAADIANETALRNREMASENAGRLTVEELLAPAPEAYDATDKRPRAQGIASFGMFDPLVDRIKEISSEDDARNAAASAGDVGAFLDVGSENDPAFLSSAMEALSNPAERFQDGFSPMAEVSTLSGDNFINDPNTGYSYPTDVPTPDPKMEGRRVVGEVIDVLQEGEGGLPEDIYGGYENPESIARRQERERMISLEPLGEGRQSDVETILKDRIDDEGPNLVPQDAVIPTSEAEKRREDAEAGLGIASLKPDAGGSTTSSGGAYGSIESRIAKMLSDRESSAEADKWMALAQTGMALMASKNPTFGGALGEAGLAGVGALQKSRKAYDSDIMSLLGMQQKIQSAKSLDASRSAKSTSGGSKELNTMIDNARADLSLANAEAAKYFRVEPGDPAAGTEDRMINMIPKDVQANVIAARDRLEALNRIAIGGGTQFDATQ